MALQWGIPPQLQKKTIDLPRLYFNTSMHSPEQKKHLAFLQNHWNIKLE
jgi:hypothetical protein